MAPEQHCFPVLAHSTEVAQLIAVTVTVELRFGATEIKRTTYLPVTILQWKLYCPIFHGGCSRQYRMFLYSWFFARAPVRACVRACVCVREREI